MSVIVEKTGRTGGNAWLAVVMLGLGDSGRLQPDMTDWRDQTFAALMQFGKWTLDAKLMGAFVDTYPEVVALASAQGDAFRRQRVRRRRAEVLHSVLRWSASRDYKVSDPARGPGFIGSSVGELLLDECRELGVKILTRTRATRILLDESGREVRGVVVSGPDGELHR